MNWSYALLFGLCALCAGCGGSSPGREEADVSGKTDVTGPAGDVNLEDLIEADSNSGDVHTPADGSNDSIEDDIGTDSRAEGCGTGVRRIFTIGVDEHCSSAGDNCWPYAWANSSPPSGEAAPTMSVGDCVFVRAPPMAWCDPECEPGTYCDEVTLTCVDHQPPVSAGIIDVTGLKATCQIVPETQYYYYTPTFTPEPADGEIFDEGSTIVATAEGADVPAFSASATGVANLDTDLTCPPQLQSGQSVTVNWTKSAVGNVSLFLGSGNHASQFSRIECKASADKGQFVVDGGLITELLADGAPIWRWNLTRATTDCETAGDFDVVLSVTTSQSCMW